MVIFLREQATAITEYDEPLVRWLIKKVIFGEKFTVVFKSGLTVGVNV
ncbi:integrase [Desulfosporosinus sp. Sb-LF]|nr:integrase [Desulfosporosinus sp. Sb-LF]TGE31463.1 integrase [Desulfosporosinus sp. Sb-LF]